MTLLTKEAVLDQLREVIDPCSITMRNPRDICQMGLVESVDVIDDDVHVELVLTDVSCWFYREIRRHVVDAITRLPGVRSVRVELAANTVWTPERMQLHRWVSSQP